MKFKVIVRFVDLKDGNHIYNVEDEFPRVGKKVSEERIDELKSSKNKRGVPLIEEVPEAVKKPAKEEPVEVHKEPNKAEEKTEKEPTPKKTSRKRK